MADLFSGGSSDWLGITQAAHKDAEAYFNAGVRTQIEQDIRQFQGLHPTDSKYLSDGYKARSRFFRPKTRATIRKNEAVAAAAFFSNTDIVEISAWDDSDPRQRAAAELHKQLLQLRLKRQIPWYHIALGGYQDAQASGLVCAHVHWKVDKKKGVDHPMIDLVPIENIEFSPAASWFDVVNSSPFLIHKIPMYVKDVQARMSAAPGKTDPGKWYRLTDAQILAGVQAYSDPIKLARENKRLDAQAQASTLTPYQLVWVYRTIADVNGTDYMWYSLQDSVLLSDGKPLSDSYWHGMRPYIIGNAVLESHKVYPPGVSRLTRELQAELNENANQRSDNVKFAMNKRYFGKRGAQLDIKSLTRNVPSSVTLMNDPEKDVVVQETKDVTRSAFEEQDRLNIDFDEIAGSNSKHSASDRNDLANKVGGAELLTEDSNLIEGYQLRTYTETFIEPVLYQVMRLEQHYETDEAVLMLCGRKGALDKHGVSEIDDNLIMQDLALTVHVGIGATSPRKQLDNLLFGFARIKELLETPTLSQYGLDVQELMNEIFGKLGYRTADRFFKWDDQDPQVMALNAQVQQLTVELKNKKDPPEIVAQKVALLQAQVKKTLNEAFNVNVEGLFGSMQAAEVVAAVPAVAPVADTIAKAAGYQDPTPPGVDPGIQPGGAAPSIAGGPPAPQPAAPAMDPSQGGAPGAQAPGAAVGPDAVGSAAAPGTVFAKGGVTNKRTGIGFNPAAIKPAGAGGAGAGVKPGLPPGTPANTHPTFPAKPASADAGAHLGIEGGHAAPAPGSTGSAHPTRALAGPPAVQPPKDDAQAEHERAKDLIEHKAKVEAKYGKPDPGVAKAEAYKQKQAEKDKADKEKADKAKADEKQKKAEEDAKARHEEHKALLKSLADGQQKIAEHLGKPKPKVVIKRDAKGNAISFEPQG